MTRDEQYAYIFLFIFSLIFMIWIVPAQIVAGENASVSPRTVPLICGGIIALISLIQIVRSVISHQLVQSEFLMDRRNYQILFISVVMLIVIGFIMNQLPTIYVNGVAVGRFWLGSFLLVPAFLFFSRVFNWKAILIYTFSLIITTFILAGFAGIYLP